MVQTATTVLLISSPLAHIQLPLCAAKTRLETHFIKINPTQNSYILSCRSDLDFSIGLKNCKHSPNLVSAPDHPAARLRGKGGGVFPVKHITP